MDRSPAIAPPAGGSEAAARWADGVLRRAGDLRLAAGLLVVAAAWNVIAAAWPAGLAALDTPPYAVLLGAIALSGLAGVAVRVPVAWREWRRPGSVPEGRGALEATLAAQLDAAAVATRLRELGYRTRVVDARAGWAVHGTRRGWSRFAGLGSHAALVLVLVGAAVSGAYASEVSFSLLPGEQALLDAPRPGFTDAVRFDALDAAFGSDGRPQRLDTTVTFLRDGSPVSQEVLQVNAPGGFGGATVHAWTYGPAVGLRVTTLAGRVLHDGTVALSDVREGRPIGTLELPSAGTAVAVLLADAATNTVAVASGSSGRAADAVLLRPGQAARVGEVQVNVGSFSSWVTFLARRDPGLPMLVAGGAALCVCLAAVFWLPRRRVTVRTAAGGLRLVLRGARFDLPVGELDRLRAALEAP